MLESAAEGAIAGFEGAGGGEGVNFLEASGFLEALGKEQSNQNWAGGGLLFNAVTGNVIGAARSGINLAQAGQNIESIQNTLGLATGKGASTMDFGLGMAIAGGASIFSSLLGYSAAGRAADAQVAGSNYAAELARESAASSAQIMAAAQVEAARLQSMASEKATAELGRQYDVTTAQLKPWVTAGEEALKKYTSMVNAGPGDFKTSPGYEFRLEEGARAIEQSGAAKGKQLSGQTLMGLNEWGQNMASAEYDKFLTQYYQSLLPYQDISNTGLNAAAKTAAAGSATASGIANIETGTASSIAQGLLSSASQQGNYSMTGANLAGNAAQNAATARASGYINAANAISSPINSLTSLYALSQFMGKGSSGLQLSGTGTGTVGNLSQYLTM